MTEDQKRALTYARSDGASSTTSSARAALLCLEPYKVGQLECYSTLGRRYPARFTSLGRCHIRDVCEDAAKKTCDSSIKHTQTQKVHQLLGKYSDVAIGRVFHIRKQHWVALARKGEGEDAIYYDDSVYLEVNNYEGASAALTLAQDMSDTNFERLMTGKEISAKGRKKKQLAQEKFSKLSEKQNEVCTIVIICTFGDYYSPNTLVLCSRGELPKGVKRGKGQTTECERDRP